MIVQAAHGVRVLLRQISEARHSRELSLYAIDRNEGSLNELNVDDDNKSTDYEYHQNQRSVALRHLHAVSPQRVASGEGRMGQ